ncbi:MAG: hypothetical protein V2A74_00610, partial [bacterium]
MLAAERKNPMSVAERGLKMSGTALRFSIRRSQTPWEEFSSHSSVEASFGIRPTILVNAFLATFSRAAVTFEKRGETGDCQDLQELDEELDDSGNLKKDFIGPLL